MCVWDARTPSNGSTAAKANGARRNTRRELHYCIRQTVQDEIHEENCIIVFAKNDLGLNVRNYMKLLEGRGEAGWVKVRFYTNNKIGTIIMGWFWGLRIFNLSALWILFEHQHCEGCPWKGLAVVCKSLHICYVGGWDQGCQGSGVPRIGLIYSLCEDTSSKVNCFTLDKTDNGYWYSETLIVKLGGRGKHHWVSLILLVCDLHFTRLA